MKNAWWLLAPIALVACSDSLKVSESKADEHAARLEKLTAADTGELQRGLPAAAKKLAATAPDGTGEIDPRAVRATLKTTRDAIPDLQIAKSTFFALASPAGEVWASDQESDALVGKNLIKAFPALDAARTATAPVEARGAMDELRGVRQGDDLAWVIATPVAGKDGGPTKALYVSGWSMRRYAYHLEEQLKSEIRNDPALAGKEPPLLYVFVVVDQKAYGTPVSPDVNRQAVEGLGVLDKLKAGPAHGRVESDKREFGWAARTTPALGANAAVVVLRSEV